MHIDQETIEGIIAELVADGRSEVRGFGVFELRKRRAHTARNPRTGARVAVPERLFVAFRPSPLMQERVRRMVADATDSR